LRGANRRHANTAAVFQASRMQVIRLSPAPRAIEGVDDIHL